MIYAINKLYCYLSTEMLDDNNVLVGMGQMFGDILFGA